MGAAQANAMSEVDFSFLLKIEKKKARLPYCGQPDPNKKLLEYVLGAFS